MPSKNVILGLPASAYADLKSLAEKEQTEPSEMIARLIQAARREFDLECPTLFRAATTPTLHER